MLLYRFAPRELHCQPFRGPWWRCPPAPPVSSLSAAPVVRRSPGNGFGTDVRPFPLAIAFTQVEPKLESDAGRSIPVATDIRLKEGLPEITDAIVATYTECSRINHLGHKPLPSRDAVVDILTDLMEILFPGFGRRQNLHMGNIEYHVGDLIDGLHDKLTQQIARALRHEHECLQDDRQEQNGREDSSADFEAAAQQKAVQLLRRLPELRSALDLDVQAAFEGDPAAKTHHEIIFCYPGVDAIAVYRVAHALLQIGVPLI